MYNDLQHIAIMCLVFKHFLRTVDSTLRIRIIVAIHDLTSQVKIAQEIVPYLLGVMTDLVMLNSILFMQGTQ